MSEFIPIRVKRALIILAEELDYARAAERLNLTSRELQNLVSAIELQLCLNIFVSKQEKVELTNDGRFLINAFREAVAVHTRRSGDSTGNIRG